MVQILITEFSQASHTKVFTLFRLNESHGNIEFVQQACNFVFFCGSKYSQEKIPKNFGSENAQWELNNQIPIKIIKGYSRDHRPDLKQFILDLIVSGDGDIPLFLRVANGNENDKVVFGKIAYEYKSMINFETMIVGDSALYTENKPGLKDLHDLHDLRSGLI